MIPYWVYGIYYLEKPGYRYYILSDNSVGYDENGTQTEVWRKKDLTLLPMVSCDPFVRNHFLIYTIFSDIVLREFRLFLDGNPVGYVDTWFDTWVKSQYAIPQRFSIFYSPEKTLTLETYLPFSHRGNNVVIFSEDRLLRDGQYDRDLPKIEKIVETNKSAVSDREYRPFVTTLPVDFPQRSYDPRVKVHNIHHGQLKLLLAEIEFLTLNSQPLVPTLVLYPGGGPGDHLPFLSQMFPDCYFILIDPVFEHTKGIKIVPDKRILIRADIFRNEYLQKFTSIAKVRDVLLISDIRSTPPQFLPKIQYEEEFEKHVIYDMDLQRKWYEDTKASKTMLKFRLPFTPGITQYMCGDLYFQAFPPGTSTELRLSLDETASVCDYSNTKIEKQMFYFNTVYRPSNFYDLDPLFGKDYDTLRECLILTEFLKYRGIEPSTKNIYNMFGLIDRFFYNRVQITEFLLK